MYRSRDWLSLIKFCEAIITFLGCLHFYLSLIKQSLLYVRSLRRFWVVTFDSPPIKLYS